jgi:hypothetical protein
MAIGVIIDAPGGTQAQYDRVLADVGPHLPADLLVHAAGPREGGFVLVDVWESQEALDRFVAQRLRPALQAAGWPAEVSRRVFPVRTLRGAAAPAR